MRQVRMEMQWFAQDWDGADRRQEVRRHWERLLNRAEFLDDRDRMFLEMAAAQRGQVSRLALLTGRPETSLRRQMRTIARRLLGSELRAMIERPESFTNFEKACLRENIVRGRPLVEVAEGFGVSMYRVRKTVASGRAKAKEWTTEKK